MDLKIILSSGIQGLYFDIISVLESHFYEHKNTLSTIISNSNSYIKKN